MERSVAKTTKWSCKFQAALRNLIVFRRTIRRSARMRTWPRVSKRMESPIEHPFRSRTLMTGERLGHGLLERLALEAAGDQVAVRADQEVRVRRPHVVVEHDRVGPRGLGGRLAARSCRWP